MYQSLPTSPGVYIFKDKQDKIIYVGKAINLKKRVSQYFLRDDALGPKTQTLVSQIAKIDYQTVGSEIEALILESSLIKKYKPKYNSKLTDDRSYIYICITKEKCPIIFSTHRSKIPENCFIYGPFPSGTSVRLLLKTIRRIFPFYTRKIHSKSPCLYCHLNLCPGVNPDLKTYRRNISKIKKILSGNIRNLAADLKKEMKKFSDSQNFESAMQIRDQINSLNYVVSGWQNLNNLFEKVDLPEDESSRAVDELKTLLKPYFPKISSINRIECFDISNLGSRYFVGSMSVFENGFLNKNEYRKFKINSVIARSEATKQSRFDLEDFKKSQANDPFMIKEVVYRRLKHPEWQYPEIVMVDGGKPQVSAAASALNILVETPDLASLTKKIVLIGLAKKEETIIFKNANDWVKVNLPKNSNALKLLQNLRDESHRFANKYRKELIKKSF